MNIILLQYLTSQYLCISHSGSVIYLTVTSSPCVYFDPLIELQGVSLSLYVCFDYEGTTMRYLTIRVCSR